MNEWVENLLVNRPDLKRERLERTCAEMNRAVPDALVAGYDELIPTMLLRDLDDRHVVAAAIIGDAETILTFNLKDFPTQDLPVGIQAASPDDYLSRMFDSQPEAFVATMAEHRASLTRPPKSAIDYLETLQACGLVELTERASQHMEKL